MRNKTADRLDSLFASPCHQRDPAGRLGFLEVEMPSMNEKIRSGFVIPAHLKNPCFFCLEKEGVYVFNCGKDYVWPEPIEPGTGFAECEECSGLTPEAKARQIVEHVNNLRQIHNRNLDAQGG
jgi:hypothetical protein